MREYIKSKIVKAIKFSANNILGFFGIKVVFRFGIGIGDQICMSAIAEALYRQYNYRVVVVSDFYELFYNNPYIWKVIKVDNNTKLGTFIKKIVYIAEDRAVQRFVFRHIDGLNLDQYQKKTQNRKSLIELQSLHFVEDINYNNLKPSIFFCDEEEKNYKRFLPPYKRYALVNPNSLHFYTPNKDWGFENFQKVIDLTKDEIIWIQVGLKSEKLLDGVVDFRGKTPSLRLLAYLVKNGIFTFSNEGMYTHLSAAVDTPSFTIFGGFHPHQISSYNTTTPIVQRNMPECAYCWLKTPCPYPKKLCFEELDIKDIADRLLDFWSRSS